MLEIKRIESDEVPQSLIDYVECALHSKLQRWQLELLTALWHKKIYITGRIQGKQILTDLYREWYNLFDESLAPTCDQRDYNAENPILYTYDQLMSTQ